MMTYWMNSWTRLKTATHVKRIDPMLPWICLQQQETPCHTNLKVRHLPVLTSIPMSIINTASVYAAKM